MPGTITEFETPYGTLCIRQREKRNVDQVDLPPVVYWISMRLCPENEPWKEYEFHTSEIVNLDEPLIMALAVFAGMAPSGEHGYPSMGEAMVTFVERFKNIIIGTSCLTQGEEWGNGVCER